LAFRFSCIFLYRERVGANGNRFLAENGSCESAPECGINYEAVPALVDWNHDLLISEQANSKMGFSAFPNPGQGIFTLRSDSEISEELHLTITDLLGREIFKQTFSPREINQESRIDISTEKPGMYVLRLKYKKNVDVFRLIIE